MCGICGELRFDGQLPDLAALTRMSAKLARRGPDHAGSYSDGPLAFGHRRLAIIDLSPSADQPMVDAALQLALVFNGTIYNYRELRAELVALGLHLLLRRRQRSHPQGLPRLGGALRGAFYRHVRLRRLG